MSLTLILMRHARSSWDDPKLDDFDRPLNGRGRKSAVAIGAWLRSEGHVPDEVMVSGARRTVETWGRMAPGMPAATIMRSEPALYHAGPDTMMNVLKGATAPVVMLIGHNPGIVDFAHKLAAAAPDHTRFADYPTGATTILRFPGDAWEDIAWSTADAVDFVIPRELT